MTSVEQSAPKYVRVENTLELYDTDERGPDIFPIDTILQSQWFDIETHSPITDTALLERLERDYPPNKEAG